MSQNVKVVRGVRTPVSISMENRRRTLDERIFVLFPALARFLFSVFSRLPPRSHLRRAWLSRVIRQGCEAANRRDFDLLFVGFDQEIEFHPAPSLVDGHLPPDQIGVHRGHDGYFRMWQGLLEAWDDLKLEPEEAIDCGDWLLVAAQITGHGRYSGIALDIPLFQVINLRRGLVARQRDFADREQALEAAGLSD